MCAWVLWKRNVMYLAGRRLGLQDVSTGVMEERCDIFSRGGG